MGGSKRRRQPTTHRSGVVALPSPVSSSASPVHSCQQEDLRGKKFRATAPPESTALAARPTPDECRLAVQGLGRIHPEVVQENLERRLAFAARNRNADDKSTPITDSIINTMLSQNTTAANQQRAYANLKREFPDWEQVAESSNASRVAAAIRCAGLSKTRTERMQLMLQKVKEERGKANFEFLRDCSSDEIKKQLLQHKGMGPKTVSCVLLFALLKPEFPVDTHVLRISKQNRWVPASFSRESAYSYLNGVIPDEFKLDLHCLLVAHGKHCNQCAARGKAQFPRDFDCPLAAMRRGCKLECIKQEQEGQEEPGRLSGDGTVQAEQAM
mmetsp:Transcript_5872/g.13610  ORF Transcript_5872/g.13610 Transcript_5872/m.13610 type:complete len:328 (+) Transcript_5872:187-1170(+)